MNNDTITVLIEKPLYGGFGLARIEGKAVMVRHAIPGEKVGIRIVEDKKDYSVAEIVRILEPSGHRISPLCGNFGLCGGCSYLNADYEFELDMKKSIVADNLLRIARIHESAIPDIEVIKSQRFHYRSHAGIQYSNGEPGFNRKSTNTAIPFNADGCLLLAEKINQHIFDLKTADRQYRFAVDYRDELHVQGDGSTVLESENSLFYERDIDLFFQTNRFLRASLQKKVLQYSGLSQGETFMEIGCGVGFFSLFFGKNGIGGIGYDINRGCISWARRNLQLNSLNNIEFRAISAEKIHGVKKMPDCILMDPPRTGLSRGARKSLLSISPGIFVYVSCNPSTFARDLKEFIGMDYRLTKLTMVDMFPATHHIELVSLLSKEH